MKTLPLSVLFVSVFTSSCWANEVKVAVAANFYKPMQTLAAAFEKETGHHVLLSVGSTGGLFAQIKNGAPFEFFLAADQKRPAALVNSGLASASSQFTYAQGQLALWSAQPDYVDSEGKLLSKADIGHIAICNPKTAPYGAAAVEVLKHLGRYEAHSTHLVEGKSVGQTFQQVSSQAAPQGFVALSQISYNGKLNSGSAWIIPSNLYSPLNQDAVVLTAGKDNPAALALKQYLQGASAQVLIRNFGYKI